MAKRKLTQQTPKPRKRAKKDNKKDKGAQAKKSCSICAVEQPASQFPAQRLSQRCGHEDVCCLSCVESWLHHAINAFSFAEPDLEDDEMSFMTTARCPMCHNWLSSAEVEAAATPALLERWHRLRERKLLEEDPNFRWCLSPSCTSGQKVFRSAYKKIWTCDTCNFKNCIACEHPWHKGESCRTFQARMAADHPGEEKFSNNNAISVVDGEKPVKICPGEYCGRKIEREDGCAHMECYYCLTHFCWDCLALYEANGEDADHDEDCATFKRLERDTL